jgi:uncharacterized protein
VTHPIDEQPGLPTLDPPVNEETAPFWSAAAEGRLVLPRCTACGTHIWYPRTHCPACHAGPVEWVEASGRGRIHTWTVVRRPRGDWARAGPYVLALVELDEGPRVMTNVVDCDPEALAIDQPVTVVFHRAPGGGALARFRPL